MSIEMLELIALVLALILEGFLGLVGLCLSINEFQDMYIMLKEKSNPNYKNWCLISAEALAIAATGSLFIVAIFSYYKLFPVALALYESL